MKKRTYRVGYLIQSVEIGGGNRSLETLAKGLDGQEFEPVFISPGRGPMADLVRDLNFELDYHGMAPPSWHHPVKMGADFFRWRHIIKTHRLDLIHANGLYNARSVMPCARILGIPVLCHVRFALKPEFLAWVFRYLPKPDGIIYISRYMKETVHPLLEKACPSSRYWMVHNGVDTRGFTPATYDNPVPRIGVVANFQEIKGHEDVLSMVRLLVEKKRVLQCDLIGTDIQNQGRTEVLKRLVRDKGIEDKVRFLGHVNNVADHIRELDILVCPSHEEPFGRCVIEGMACGKPVVGTRVGGIPEIIVDGETGFMVPPKNPAALADAVDKLIQDPSLRQRFGQQAREHVERFFSHEHHVRKIVDIYRQVLGL